MDRSIPQAWALFGHPHPGAGRPGPRAPPQHVQQHVNWSRSHQELLSQWCDRSSHGERPRTYDKFYAKTPGNFQPSSKSSSNLVNTTDSAISMCSSDDDSPVVSAAHRKVKRRSKAKRELQYSRTLTERDVKHLERHLSMKKTIRKKIMRDLQQAFVDDPNEFASQNKLKDDKIDIKAFNFDPSKKAHHKSEQRFLDLLRDSSDDSGLGSPNNARKFRSVRERPRPRYQFTADSSTDDNSEIHVHQDLAKLSLDEVVDDSQDKKKTKRSFWDLLTGKNRSRKDKKK